MIITVQQYELPARDKATAVEVCDGAGRQLLKVEPVHGRFVADGPLIDALNGGDVHSELALSAATLADADAEVRHAVANKLRVLAGLLQYPPHGADAVTVLQVHVVDRLQRAMGLLTAAVTDSRDSVTAAKLTDLATQIGLLLAHLDDTLMSAKVAA